MAFLNEGTQKLTFFFTIAKNLKALSPSFYKQKKIIKTRMPQNQMIVYIFPFPLLEKKKTRKRLQTQEYEFKHLFKQKFQTTPPFNLSKKDNDKLVFSQSVRAGISCVPLQQLSSNTSRRPTHMELALQEGEK